MIYRILNITVKSDYVFPNFEGFEFDDADFDMEIVCSPSSLSNGSEVLLSDYKDLSVFKGGNYFLFRINTCGELLIDNDFKAGRLFLYENRDIKTENEMVLFLYRTVIECKAARNGFVSLHSACVETDGFAVAFTGYSGLGKSTRANAWKKEISAEFLSGDRPAIDTRTGVAYGVPWDGKEGIYRNAQFPLKAIFDIRRGDFTRVRRLTEAQCERILSQQCFYPMWDNETAFNVALNIKRLIRSVPIYRLICDKTEIAARETFNIICNESDEIFKEQTDMKIKEGFVIRKIGEEHIVFPIDVNINSFKGTVVLNEVSAFVFKKLKNPICFDDLLKFVLKEFSVEKAVAEKDLKELIENFADMGILEYQD